MRFRLPPILLLGALIVSFSNAAGAGRKVTIAYTAGTSGKLAACGCPGDPYGGLSERATVISRLRAKEGAILLLDGGNMVSLFGDFQERAACVMRLMNLMSYDAAGVGRQEMFRNTHEALKFAKTARFPLLSATMAAKNGDRPFDPYVIRTVGGVRIGIVAVCDSNAYIPDINREFDYTVLPLDRALKPILESMKGSVDFIVVLSQMDEKADMKLLATFPQIDLVIEGYGNKALEKPVPSGRGYIAAPGSRGRYVGVLTLERDGASSDAKITRSELIEVLDIPADRKADEIIRAYYRSVR